MTSRDAGARPTLRDAYSSVAEAKELDEWTFKRLLVASLKMIQ